MKKHYFSNHLNTNTEEISKLDWNSRNIIENPHNEEKWGEQIEYEAKIFGDMIIRYSKLN
ncbi:hypothetical protein [Flavobacterium shii]|uniref:hypothetical protein n=1 Tax=Flavobacterium shii TaxID=2987687 RepID=UPI0021F707FC|nr:hypothetical protein [Flavobacterium shii]